MRLSGWTRNKKRRSSTLAGIDFETDRGGQSGDAPRADRKRFLWEEAKRDIKEDR